LDELDEIFGDTSGRSVWEAKVMLQARRDVGLLSLLDIEHPSETNNGEKKAASEHVH